MFKKIISFLFVSFLFVSSSWAGSSTGEISRIYVHVSSTSQGSNAGVVMFAAGTHLNKPGCSTVGDEWAFSLENEHGRAMYSLLLTAAAMKKSVTVEGEGACNGWSDRESPSFISLDP